MHLNPEFPAGVHEALMLGDVRKASELLGSPYTVHALVVHGNHLGRTLGFPTANLDLLENSEFLAAHGVYAVRVEFDGSAWHGMANAGVRPTINGRNMVIEVNIFGFSGDIYGKIIVVSFIDRIRAEMKFPGLEALVAQIRADKERALELLG